MVNQRYCQANTVCWFEQKAWIRKGSSTIEATALNLNRLDQQKKVSTDFDASPLKNASLDDIDLPLFAAYQRNWVAESIIAQNNRSPEQQLAQQGFYNLEANSPSVAGILFCGKDPQAFLPMAHINFVHTQADNLFDRSYIIDTQDIMGDIQNQKRIWEAKLQAVVTQRMTRMEAMRQPSQYSYPYQALRELMFNAVLHRDYAMSAPIRLHCFCDRIVIQSPGGLLPPADKENFPNIGSYRNPLIAASMKKLGWIEHFGNGVARVQAFLKENGNPPAEFVHGNTFTEVRVFAKP